MNSQSLPRTHLATILMLANAVFWLAFGVVFALKTEAYQPHPKLFEEESPPYIYFGRAFPAERYMDFSMRAARFVQWPSFLGAIPLNWYFSRRGIVVDHLYWGISVGGYYLMLVCLLSFLQWYVIGLSIDRARHRFTARAKRS